MFSRPISDGAYDTLTSLVRTSNMLTPKDREMNITNMESR